MKTTFAVIFAILALSANTYSQYPKVNIPGTEVRKLTSSIVAGQEYELHIMLPAHYSSGSKKYPVIYLMDAQWDFPLLTCLYGEHYFDGFIPELIIVGVTWGGDHPNPDSLRARDYTPTREFRLPQSGGADSFLSFMRSELFPFIESNYRADSSNRTLMGCSLGGLFTLYTLFTHTAMFQGYAAASPAIGWDNEVLYRYEKEFAEKKRSAPVRVYMTVGDVEWGRPAFEKFAARMAAAKYPALHLRRKVLENTGHSGTKSETYSRGLQFVFERANVKLPDDILNRYAGKYEAANGEKLELVNDKGQLAILLSPTEKTGLFAADEHWFYATFQFLNIFFSGPAGGPPSLQLERYNNTVLFKKVN